MIDSHKLEMLDDCIRSVQKAKSHLHRDRKIYTVEVVKAYGFIKSVFDALKEENEPQIIGVDLALKQDSTAITSVKYDMTDSNQPMAITYEPCKHPYCLKPFGHEGDHTI